MLNQLKSFGQTEGYFEIKRIGDFNDAQKEGFSHINTIAIDFDETTKKLCGEHRQPPCMSCDALDIIDSKNKINFIEFKQLEDNATIENWIEQKDLPQKVKDSRGVIINIIRKGRFDCRDKVKMFNSCEKNVIISFNLIDNAKKRIAILGRYLTIKAIIEKQFYDNYIQGENFNDPICIKMDNFDSKYPNYA